MVQTEHVRTVAPSRINMAPGLERELISITTITPQPTPNTHLRLRQRTTRHTYLARYQKTTHTQPYPAQQLIQISTTAALSQTIKMFGLGGMISTMIDYGKTAISYCRYCGYGDTKANIDAHERVCPKKP